MRVGAENSVTLCDLGVFVQEPADPVLSGDRDVGVDGVGERPQWAGLMQRAMRAVPVEIALVLGEDLAQMCSVHNEDPVEEFVAYAAHPPFHDRVHSRCLRSGEHDPDALGLEHLMNRAVNLRSRSLIKNRKSLVRSPRWSIRLRACWATQPAVGFVVTPSTWTRRVACSTTAKTYNRASVIVSTWKKSAARIPSA
jgi:hypothetical protein